MSRIYSDLSNKVIPTKEGHIQIINFIENARSKQFHTKESILLISMIDALEFSNGKPLQLPTYNPNIF